MSSYAYLPKLFNKLYLRWKSPTYDQFSSLYKMPQNPKIVVFGANNKAVEGLLSSYFKNYNVVAGSAVQAENADKSVLNVADTLLNYGKNNTVGHVLVDYPKSVEEARKLDTIIDAVNLAIRFETADNAAEKSDIQKYYEERGLLLTFRVDGSDNLVLSQRLHDEIQANIKL